MRADAITYTPSRHQAHWLICSVLLPVVLFMLLATAACMSGAASEREKGWRSDVDFLLQAMRQQHYIYKSRPLPEELQEQAAKLKAEVPRLSDERMLAELQRLMVYLGDGHCYVLPWGAPRVQSKGLPLRFYLFSDGLFIIDAEKGHEQWIGCRVVRFAGASAEDVMAKMSALISRDNPMGIKWIGPFLLRFRGVLEAVAMGMDAEKIRLTLEDRKGLKTETMFDPAPIPPMRGVPKLIPSKLPASPPPPLYLANIAHPYWLKELPQAQMVYVQFNQVMNAADEPLEAFALRLQRFLEEQQPQALIVDVRHNNGGNAELLPPLVNVLNDFAKRRAQNKLFVITGRNTFSAAQIFISQADHLTPAIFAGEPSSSKPNFVGEENEVILPWSGAICSISNRYHESIPGDQRVWIEPALKVELSSKDYFANYDPVLEAVLRTAGN
jgi:hypothetical protein